MQCYTLYQQKHKFSVLCAHILYCVGWQIQKEIQLHGKLYFIETWVTICSEKEAVIKDSADMDTGMNREENEGRYHGVTISEENHYFHYFK